MDELFDVIAVDINTGVDRLLAEGKTERNAEAIINMAVIRRGVEKEFYKTVPAGTKLNQMPLLKRKGD